MAFEIDSFVRIEIYKASGSIEINKGTRQNGRQKLSDKNVLFIASNPLYIPPWVGTHLPMILEISLNYLGFCHWNFVATLLNTLAL